MNIIVVDDEQLNLDNMMYILSGVLPHAAVTSFSKARKALEFIEGNPVDIAFLDIEMRGINGIEIARVLRRSSPRANILFCTGYKEYTLDAWELDSSGYLLKPITEAKIRHALENLRYPVEEREKKRVRFQCFGNFEVFCDEKPIVFKYNRTKEFLAYLVDRNGASCSIKELEAVLFEDDEHRSYVYQIRQDLRGTLSALGIEDILLQSRGFLSIRREMVECDYYDFLDGKLIPPVKEYMTQYSFGEQTFSSLFPEQL